MKQNWKLAALCCCAGMMLGIAVFLGLVLYNRWSIELTLNGSVEITLEYGEHYVEQGAVAVFAGTVFERAGRPISVAEEGCVDETRLGEYTLTYTAENMDVTEEEKRTVTIVDRIPPEITLHMQEGHYTLPGAPYEEEGYSAWDNYDGDLTAQVTVREENGVMYYSVTDSSGNEAQTQRTIYYDDPIAPILTLNGACELTIVAGDTYEEPGWSAEDNVDGDITDAVVVDSTLDTDTAGSYLITYRVQDSWGNQVQTSRVVTVKPKPIVQPPPAVIVPESKVVYLTFDDGPSAHTQTLLKVLDKYHVKATFFVTNCDPSYQNMIGAEYAAGHTVGVHTLTHDYSKVYASVDGYFQDFGGCKIKCVS